MTVILILTQEQFFQEAMKIALKDDYAPIRPAIARVSTFVFIKRFMEIYAIIKNNPSNKNLVKFISKIKVNESVVTKIPFLVQSWVVYSDQDVLFRSPKGIWFIMKSTYKGCLRASGGNQIVACSLALVTSIIALTPYAYNNQLLVIANAFIRMAYSATSYNLKDLQDSAIEVFGPHPHPSMYGL